MKFDSDNHALLSPLLRVMKVLNKLGGKHGIGRVDLVENRFVGMKSRGVYETPGGAILHFAHRQMESLTMDREVMHLRDSLIPQYSTLVYNGFWFAPEREALQALVAETQKNVTGTVRLKLYKGNIITAGRKSPVSLYNPDIATMEADPTKAYNQNDATGFIALNALRLKVASRVHAATKNNRDPNHGPRRHQFDSLDLGSPFLVLIALAALAASGFLIQMCIIMDCLKIGHPIDLHFPERGPIFRMAVSREPRHAGRPVPIDGSGVFLE